MIEQKSESVGESAWDSRIIPPITLRIPMPKGAGIPAKSKEPQAAASKTAEAGK